MSTAKQMSTVKVVPDTVVAFPESVAEMAESVVTASQPVCNWWLHHWMDASHPLARLQRAWMESVLEAIEVEAEFLKAWTLSNAKVLNCLADSRSLTDSASLHSCYHEAARDMTDAHMARFGKVAELPEDFKQRLWEEIC